MPTDQSSIDSAPKALQNDLQPALERARSESQLHSAIGHVYDLLADNPGPARKNNSLVSIFNESTENSGPVVSRDDFTYYGSEFIKSTCLFLPKGKWLSAAAFAADEARVGESTTKQMLDGIAGAGKGVLTKCIFNQAGKIPDVASRALTIGILSRTTDLGLSSHTWFSENGTWDLDKGLTKLHDGVFNPSALRTDLIVFGGASLATRGLDKVTGDFISKSPFLKTVVTGTTFGAATGAMHDIQTQLEHDPRAAIDWTSVLKHSLLKASLDSVAAMPGGALSARAHHAERPTWSTRQPSRLVAERPSDTLQTGLSLTESTRPLDMPALKSVPLAELGLRLKLEATQIEPIRVRNGAPEDAIEYGSPQRFLDTATDVVNTPVRVYSVDGHNTRIVIPEQYAAELDLVRALRLSLESGTNTRLNSAPDLSLLQRALPEDYILHLDALPDPNLVSRIIISPEANPADLWHGRQANVDKFVSAASANEETNDITYFRRNVDPYIGLEMNHEWSHLLRKDNPVLARLYDAGSQIEKTAPRERANVDAHENWSVGVGENLLNPLEYTFREYAKHSPIKTWLAAEAVQNSLQQSSHAGPAQAALRLRLGVVTNEVAPIAVAKLAQLSNGTSTDAAIAKNILVNMNKAQGITSNELNLANESIGDRHMPQLAQLKLNNLNLANTYVSELAFAENMPLSSLDVSGTRITTSSLFALQRSPVENLKIANTRVDDGAVALLSEMGQLKTLDIKGTRITPAGLLTLQGKLPTCVITH